MQLDVGQDLLDKVAECWMCVNFEPSKPTCERDGSGNLVEVPPRHGQCAMARVLAQREGMHVKEFALDDHAPANRCKHLTFSLEGENFMKVAKENDELRKKRGADI